MNPPDQIDGASFLAILILVLIVAIGTSLLKR